mgnify:FL=1
MKIKKVIFLFVLALFSACASDNDEIVPRNLGDFIETIPVSNLGGVIAYAANSEGRDDLNYIFYYPEPGAKDIRYYEAINASIDPLDFSQYRRQVLTVENVFGGKLARFVRDNNETERWCLVTYFLNGVLQISNPILLKNRTQPTQWKDNLAIDYPRPLNPFFSWTDFETLNNDVYFQAIFETEANEFVSGTYTEEQAFSFYDTTNVMFDINLTTPENLKVDTEYSITVMGVNQTDNWVNLVIQETFVPQNLAEYLAVNTLNNSQKITAFGLSKNNSSNDAAVYFYPMANARDFRYYETESLAVNKDDFENYRRKYLDSSTDFGAQLRRFSRGSTEEAWSIVTYEVDGEIFISEPIKIEIKSNATLYQKGITTIQTESLLPLFMWSGLGRNNDTYLTLLSSASNDFISGFFVDQERYQYKSDYGVIANINTNSLPELILDDEYDISVFGMNENHWVNLVIQNSFEAK